MHGAEDEPSHALSLLQAWFRRVFLVADHADEDVVVASDALALLVPGAVDPRDAVKPFFVAHARSTVIHSDIFT